MPKVSREDAVKREIFAFNYFVANPGSSVAKANDALKDAFPGTGHMRAVRMYELRALAEKDPNATITPAVPVKKPQVISLAGPGTEDIAKKPVSLPPTTMQAPPRPIRQVSTQPAMVAFRQPGEAAAQALPMLIRLDGLSAAGAISAALEELRMAGLTNLRVESEKDRYVILDVAQ